MKRVLIIDDNEETLKIIKYSLENEYECFTLSNPMGALELISEKNIDLVITDIIMPEQEGMKTIQILKKIYPNIKIIAISGGGMGDKNEYLYFAKHMGADITLSKPFFKTRFN